MVKIISYFLISHKKFLKLFHKLIPLKHLLTFYIYIYIYISYKYKYIYILVKEISSHFFLQT